MVHASYNRQHDSQLESARLNAKMALNFRVAKRILDLSQNIIMNPENRKNVQFKRDLIRFTQDKEFRAAMQEYINMTRSTEDLETQLHGIIPKELIQCIVEYGNKLPKNGTKTRKYRKKKQNITSRKGGYRIPIKWSYKNDKEITEVRNNYNKLEEDVRLLGNELAKCDCDRMYFIDKQLKAKETELMQIKNKGGGIFGFLSSSSPKEILEAEIEQLKQEKDKCKCKNTELLSKLEEKQRHFNEIKETWKSLQS